MSRESSIADCPICATAVLPGDVKWIKDGFEIVRCPRCELVFRAELPGSAEISSIYGSEYFTREDDDDSGQGYLDYVADAELHRLNARRRLKSLGAARGRRRLLDVGAAAGFFVEQAGAAGWDARGVDVSERMAGYGRSELGVDVDTGLFQSLEVREAVDVVTMWDYIEHSFDPVGDLGRAFEILEPGGILAISTGDIGSIVGRVSGSRWHLLTPRHHNFFFSVDTLSDALRRSGFELLGVRHSAYWFSVGYLLHKTRTMLPGSSMLDRLVGRFAGSRIGQLSVPVNLFDVMTVVARKPVVEGRPS